MFVASYLAQLSTSFDVHILLTTFRFEATGVLLYKYNEKKNENVLQNQSKKKEEDCHLPSNHRVGAHNKQKKKEQGKKLKNDKN